MPSRSHPDRSRLFLGLDVSTTGAKALLVDGLGGVVASGAGSYAVSTPHPLWSEQMPTDWWDATCASIHSVLQSRDPSEVEGIGLTGQMHGLVLLDASAKILRPAILWNDQRTGPQSEWITQTVGPERLLSLTNNRSFPGFTAPKLVWVRQNEPEVYAKIARVLLPKDYIRFLLTGDFATDLADASGTLLLDVSSRRWSSTMLEALEIPAAWLPALHEGPEVTGRVGPRAARETGLREGTPVVAGGGDQAAQAIGVGAVREGTVAITLGTSGVVFAPTAAPYSASTGGLHSFCHAVPGRWHLMGVVLSAGGSLRWFRDALCVDVKLRTEATGRDAYESIITDEAAMAPPGSEGLLFLPYLTGERTPFADPLARGAFVGLTTRHTRAHMARAVLEGVAYALRDSLTLLRQAGLPEVGRAVISGGGARSAEWRQILANVLGLELVTPEVLEGAAFGAALLAGVAAGQWPSIEQACDRVIRAASRQLPEQETVRSYDRAYEIYKDLYPSLRRAFHRLAGQTST
jgi:xylulokinase